MRITYHDSTCQDPYKVVIEGNIIEVRKAFDIRTVDELVAKLREEGVEVSCRTIGGQAEEQG